MQANSPLTPLRLALAMGACLLLSACPHDTHYMKMEDQLNRYAAAVRWGLWETASEFQRPDQQGRLDLAFLKSIHVTSYDQVYRQEHPGSNVIRQTIEIRYYREQNGVEQTLTDRQTWRYDNKKDRWFLQTGLPDFR